MPAFHLEIATARTAIVLTWLAALLTWISARPVELALQAAAKQKTLKSQGFQGNDWWAM